MLGRHRISLGKLILTNPELPDRIGRAVKSFKRRVVRKGDDVTETVTEVTLWSKTEALKEIGLHLGFKKENAAGAGGVAEFIYTLEMLQAAERRAVEEGLLAPMARPQPKVIEGVTEPTTGE